MQYSNIITGCGALFVKCHVVTDSDIRQIVRDIMATGTSAICFFFDEFCKDNSMDLPTRFPGIPFLSAVQLATSIFSNTRAELTASLPSSKSSSSQRQQSQYSQSQMISHTGAKKSHGNSIAPLYPDDMTKVKNEPASVMKKKIQLKPISPKKVVLSSVSDLPPVPLFKEEPLPKSPRNLESRVQQAASDKEDVDLGSIPSSSSRQCKQSISDNCSSSRDKNNCGGNMSHVATAVTSNHDSISNVPDEIGIVVKSDLSVCPNISKRKREHPNSSREQGKDIPLELELSNKKKIRTAEEIEDPGTPRGTEIITAGAATRSRQTRGDRYLGFVHKDADWINAVENEERSDLMQMKRKSHKSEFDILVDSTNDMDHQAVRVEASYITRSLIVKVADRTPSRSFNHERSIRDVRCFRKNMIRVVDMCSVLDARYMESVLPKESEREIQLRLDAEADECRENYVEEMFADRYTLIIF